MFVSKKHCQSVQNQFLKQTFSTCHGFEVLTCSLHSTRLILHCHKVANHILNNKSRKGHLAHVTETAWFPGLRNTSIRTAVRQRAIEMIS